MYRKIAAPLHAALIALAALPVASAAAETTADDDRRQLDEIVVSATPGETPLSRLPFAVDVIDAEEIQTARPLLGLDEALQGVAGLQMQNRYNFAQDLRISLRGFGARSAFGIRGIRIIVDGIPETLADGQGGVDGIDLGAAERIEVLRGGASAVYGNAGGGVLLVSSERGTSEPTLQWRVATGSDGYRRWQGKLGGESGRLNYLLSASDLKLDGYREQSAARNRQYTLRLGFAASDDSNWLLSAHHTDQPLAEDPGGVNRAQFESDPASARDANATFDAGEALRQSRIGVRWRRAVGTGGEWLVRGYFSDRAFEGRLPFTAGGTVAFDRRYLGAGLNYRQDFEFAGRKLRWIAGIDLDRQRDDRDRFDNLAGSRGALTLRQREEVDSDGVFAQLEWRLSETLGLTLGARYDRLRFDVRDGFLSDGDDSGAITINEFSPLLAAHWQWRDEVAFYANVSRSFESPTTTELANPTGAGGFNPSLESATALHREFGARGTTQAGDRWSLALYQIDIDDELLPFEVAAFPGRDFFQNTGSTDRRGIELGWSRQWHPRWLTRFTHSWSDFRFDRYITDAGEDFSGNRTPGTARHVSFAELKYTHSGRWFAALEATRFGELALNNANTEESDDYTLLTARAGLEFETPRVRWNPSLSISNMLDERYAANTRINAFGGRYFEAGPGRAVYLDLRAAYRLR